MQRAVLLDSLSWARHCAGFQAAVCSCCDSDTDLGEALNLGQYAGEMNGGSKSCESEALALALALPLTEHSFVTSLSFSICKRRN